METVKSKYRNACGSIVNTPFVLTTVVNIIPITTLNVSTVFGTIYAVVGKFSKRINKGTVIFLVIFVLETVVVCEDPFIFT